MPVAQPATIDPDGHDSESPAGPASDGEHALADARKKKKRAPPRGFLANDEMDESRGGADDAPVVSPASDSNEHGGMNGSQPPCEPRVDEPEDGVPWRMRPDSCNPLAESSGSSSGTGAAPIPEASSISVRAISCDRVSLRVHAETVVGCDCE